MRFSFADEQLRRLETQLSDLRHRRKQAAEARDSDLGKTLKDQLRQSEDEHRIRERDARDLLMQIPNLAFDDVAVGAGETANSVIRE